MSELLLQLLEGWALEREYSDCGCCWEGVLHAASLPLNGIRSYCWHQEPTWFSAPGKRHCKIKGWNVTICCSQWSAALTRGVFSLCLRLPSELAVFRNSIWLAWQTVPCFSHLKLLKNSFMLKMNLTQGNVMKQDLRLAGLRPTGIWGAEVIEEFQCGLTGTWKK